MNLRIKNISWTNILQYYSVLSPKHTWVLHLDTHTWAAGPFRMQKRKVNHSFSFSSTRTCLFTAANDRSHKCFHRYVQRDINSSHLLHKAHSAGTVQGTREHGDKRTHTVHWAQTHLFYPPTEKGTKFVWEDGEEEDERRGERRGLGISTHIQIQKNMYKSYSLQALCSYIYSRRNRQRNHSMAGPSVWDMQVQGLAVRKQSQLYEVWDKNQWSLRGRRGRRWRRWRWQTHAERSAAAWGINHCRELHNQVLPIGARCESSRQVTPHWKKNTHSTRTFILGTWSWTRMTHRADVELMSGVCN